MELSQKDIEVTKLHTSIKNIYDEMMNNLNELNLCRSYDIGNNLTQSYNLIPNGEFILRHFESTIISIAKKTINKLSHSIEIPGEFHEVLIQGLNDKSKKKEEIMFNGIQSAMYMVHFIMIIVNKYLSCAEVPQVYKVTKVIEHKFCEDCTIWFKCSNNLNIYCCPWCELYNNSSNYDDDESYDYRQQDDERDKYRKKGVIVTAHINVYTIETSYNDMKDQIKWKSLTGHIYKDNDQKPNKNSMIQCLKDTIIDIAKKILHKSFQSFDISGEHHYDLNEGDVAQNAIYLAKFILGVLNKYFANTGLSQRYKLKNIKTNKMCNICSLWNESSSICNICNMHKFNPGNTLNNYYENEYGEYIYRQNSVIITAHIEKYTNKIA